MTLLYQLAGFELDPTARTLSCEGAPLHLGVRAFDVLPVLPEDAGSLVTKEQLLQRAWAGLLVEEAGMAVQISALRKLLSPQAIATTCRATAPASSVVKRCWPASRNVCFGRGC